VSRTVDVLLVLLALIFLGSGVAALAGASQITQLLDRLGVGAGLAMTIALLELAAVGGLLIGIVWRPLGVAAAVGLALLMTGAVVRHVQAADGKGGVPAAVLGVLAAVTASLAAADLSA